MNARRRPTTLCPAEGLSTVPAMATGLISIDQGSSVPPFEQVRAQLAARIGDGRLVAGTRLPTVRRLADDLGLAVNTVARAYRELEGAGLVDTRGRGGTVVTAAGDRSRERLQDAAQRYAALAHDLAVPDDEAVRLVRAALESGRA
jgi:DNA-binding transcriptional regulator YhcF (GntR family)